MLKQAPILRAFLNNLPPNVRKRVDVLREIQDEKDEQHKNFLEERAALKYKYQELHQALFKKRREIVNGETEVEDLPDKEGDKEKGIPNFWLIAMKKSLSENLEIYEKDEGALKYLKDIKWRFEDLDNLGRFVLEFYFDSNPYFKNDILFKTYILEGSELGNGFILKKALGSEIKWTARKRPKQPKKSVTKTEDSRSFFDFFNTYKNIGDVENMQEEELSKLLSDELKRDYEIGKAIRDKLVFNAVSWFTKEACVQKNTDDTVKHGRNKTVKRGGNKKEDDNDDDGAGDEEDDDGAGAGDEDDSDYTDTRKKKKRGKVRQTRGKGKKKVRN